MRRLVAALVLVVSCGWPSIASSSGGGQIKADLRVSSGGYKDPTDGTPASARWVSDFRAPDLDSGRDFDGLFPARLTEATLEPLEKQDLDSGCTNRTQLLGIADPTARVHVGVVLDLPHDRGTVLLTFPDVESMGLVRLETRYMCQGDPDTVADRVASVNAILNGVFDDTEPWPLHRVNRRLWAGGGKRSETLEDTNPTVAVMQVRLHGTPTELDALCLKPTARQLRGARTERQALRILRRFGFKRQRGLSLVRSGRVPRTHWFVPSQADFPTDSCGDRVVLAQSSGPNGPTI